MNLQGILPYFLSATTAISASLLPLQESHAAEENLTIKIENPDAVGSKLRTVDCGTLERIAGENKMSCKFAEQVDGQQICKDEESKGLVPEIASARKYMTIFSHNAKKHDQCIREYTYFGKQAYKNIGDEDKLNDFLSDAKEMYLESGKRRDCVVLKAIQQCEAEHGSDLLLD